LLLFLASFSVPLSAQEVCDNSIDDDGDGLIDLNDPDCTCAGIIGSIDSLIPNPSFEDTLCCPTSYSQMHCAATWIQASYGTSDYFNRCGYTYVPINEGTADTLYPPPPGAGDGYVGFY